MNPINIWFIMFLNTKDLFVNQIHFCIKFKFHWHIFKHSNSRWFCSNSKDMKREVKSASDQISLFFCICFLQAFAKVSLCLDKKEVCLNGFLKTIPCIRVATHHCARQMFWRSQSSTEIKPDILNFYRSGLGSQYRTKIGMCEAEDENKFIIFFEFLLLYIIDWNPGRVSDKCKAVPPLAFCVYFLFCFACSSGESCHQNDGQWLVLCLIMKRTSDLKLLKFSKQYYIYLCIVGFFTKHSDLSYVVP